MSFTEDNKRWNAPANKPELELKGFKSFKGMECDGCNATLLVDGKRAAEVLDEGNGGNVMIRWFPGTRALEAKWDAYVAAVEPVVFMDTPLKPDDDQAIGHLIDVVRVSKLCAGRVVFDQGGVRRSMKGAFTTDRRDAILKDYPGAVFINEALGQTLAPARTAEDLEREALDKAVKKGLIVFKADSTKGWKTYPKRPLDDAFRAYVASKHGAAGLVFHNDIYNASASSKSRAA